jgi:predicted ATP-binding protein involved in virulence
MPCQNNSQLTAITVLAREWKAWCRMSEGKAGKFRQAAGIEFAQADNQIEFFMFAKKLELHGYGPFQKATIDLWSEEAPDRKVTVLIGENGAGKSAVLDGLATLLSWLPARIRNDKGAGYLIDELKIHTGLPYAALTLSANAQGEEYTWSLAKAAKGKRVKTAGSLKDVSLLASLLSTRYTQDENCSLPFIGYYPTERYVLDIPHKIRKRHTFKQIDGYDGALTIGIDFRLFFEWFRDREDTRNEGKIDLEEILPFIGLKGITAVFGEHDDGHNVTFEEILSFLGEERLKKLNPELYNRVKNREQLLNDPQYFAVVRALNAFMPEYTSLRIERKPRMRMLIDKNNQSFNILQLSQGEKSLLALVGDIARRLAIMNPGLAKPLDGEGIVLIDEIDLHLHPRWQRTIVRRLREAFPNCQFILTTHSPLVVSDPDNIRVLALKSGEIREMPNLYGMDVEQVFLEIMDTPLRDPALQNTIDALLEAIQDRELEKAKTLRRELGAILPPDHRELVRADIFLRRQEALHAKNH